MEQPINRQKAIRECSPVRWPILAQACTIRAADHVRCRVGLALVQQAREGSRVELLVATIEQPGSLGDQLGTLPSQVDLGTPREPLDSAGASWRDALASKAASILKDVVDTSHVLKAG